VAGCSGGGDGDDGNSETSDGGDTDSDGGIQPGEITGTAESSVDGLEVVGHEVTAVDPQIRIELELRNAGDENNINLTHHNFNLKLTDAAGNDVLRQQGTRGPETATPPGETGVVSVFLFPEPETRPKSYEISINCDTRDTLFNYCEGE